MPEVPAADTRRIPVGGEFSPGQTPDLRALLTLVKNAPDEAAIMAGFDAMFPKFAGKKRSPNVLYAMREYGLYDRSTAALTPLGETLRALPDAEMWEAFARHILLQCSGMAVLQAVQDLHDRGEKGQKATLDTELRRRGFNLPPDTTNHLNLLNWLAVAGVVKRVTHDYVINDDVVEKLAGISIGVVNEWAALRREQRAFLQVLKQQSLVHKAPEPPLLVKDVRRLVELHYPGVAFKGNLRAVVLDPLESAGWLTTKGKLSTGKSGHVAATKKLLSSDVDLASRLSIGLIPGELRKRLNTPLRAVYSTVTDKSASKHDRGLALEILALRLAYDVGLTPMGFRLRASEAGYGEVDLLAEGAHLLFSRWLFQCKAIKSYVDLADLAKEIGMAVLLRAHVVVMVTTGTFSGPVRDHARKAVENTPLQVILIDDRLLRSYRKRGSAVLFEHLQETAATALARKRGQVEGIV